MNLFVTDGDGLIGSNFIRRRLFETGSPLTKLINLAALASASTEVGWDHRRDFSTSIAKTVDWYLQNRPWTADITSEKYARERVGFLRQGTD